MQADPRGYFATTFKGRERPFTYKSTDRTPSRTTMSSASHPSSSSSGTKHPIASTSSTIPSSISAALVAQTQEPPRKRPRISTQFDTSRPASSLSSAIDDSDLKHMYDIALTSDAERDGDYYFPEADCVVRVGGSLFKVSVL